MNIYERIELAKDWLLNSGIQNLNGKNIGAFNSWYDNSKKSYEYAYSEITGYGINTLMFFYHLKKDKIFLERAKLAADWLMNKAKHKSNGVLTRYFYDKASFMGSFENEEIFSFDCGMVLNGMTSLYKVSKEKMYLDFNEKLANFMIDKMQKEDGSFYAVYDAKNNKLIDNGEKWSTQSGCLHAKLSIGLTNLYELTQDKKYLDSAKKVCDNSLRFLKNDGRFVTFSESGDTLFHPHCYAIEGLYVAGNYFNNKKYLEIAKQSIIYLFNQQLKNGGIPQIFQNGKFIEFERSDILAQALRLGVLFLQDIDNKKLEKLVKRLLEFQNLKEEQKGGFMYGFDSFGKKYEHLNSWCTMFALQALELYKQSLENKLNFDGFLMV